LDLLRDIPTEIIPVASLKIVAAEQGMNLQRKITAQVLMADFKIEGKIQVACL